MASLDSTVAPADQVLIAFLAEVEMPASLRDQALVICFPPAGSRSVLARSCFSNSIDISPMRVHARSLRLSRCPMLSEAR